MMPSSDERLKNINIVGLALSESGERGLGGGGVKGGAEGRWRGGGLEFLTLRLRISPPSALPPPLALPPTQGS